MGKKVGETPGGAIRIVTRLPKRQWFQLSRKVRHVKLYIARTANLGHRWMRENPKAGGRSIVKELGKMTL